MEKCTSWRGHKYEGRYDKSQAQNTPEMEVRSGSLPEILEKYRRVTYVRDICVRCGHVIERVSP